MTTKTKQVAPQADTVTVSLASIRRDPNFAAGFADYRAGRSPAFDTFDDFAYERGRQFAAMTPPTLRLNSREAATLFRSAFNQMDLI